MRLVSFFVWFSLNDSFAHIKRQLAATEYRNEMMDFMWSTFRKVAGINNRKTSESENEEIQMKNINKKEAVPLATADPDEL
jgi:hypothetical protein